MKFTRQLAKVEVVALASLVVAAFVLASFAAIQTSLHASPFFKIADSVRVVFLYTLAIGSIPVVAIGAPLYAALLYHGRASGRRFTASGFGGSVHGGLLS